MKVFEPHLYGTSFFATFTCCRTWCHGLSRKIGEKSISVVTPGIGYPGAEGHALVHKDALGP